MENCPLNKIYNPSTKRCVLKSGKIGKQLLKEKKSPKAKATSPKEKAKQSPIKAKVNSPLKGKAKATIPNAPKKLCGVDKILNPATGRCVSIDGKIGMNLIKNSQKGSQNKVSPPNKVSPNKVSPNKVSPKQKAPGIKGKIKPIISMSSYKKSFISPQKSWKNNESRYSLSVKDIGIQSVDDALKKDRIGYEKYIGTKEFLYAWMMDIRNKIGKDKVCLIRHNAMWRDYVFYYNAVPGTQSILGEEHGREEVNRCKNYQYSIYILFIIGQDINMNHANALIFNNKNKVLLRFEPHGSNVDERIYNPKKLDKELNMFAKTLGAGWTYKAPIDYCPIIGPQIKENLIVNELKRNNAGGFHPLEAKGFCGAWSMIFIEYKLRNPKLSDKSIINHILKLDGLTLANKIRQYAALAVVNKEKYGLKKAWETKNHFVVGDKVVFKILDNLKSGIIIKKHNNGVDILTKNGIEKNIAYSTMTLMGKFGDVKELLNKKEFKDLGIKVWYKW
jgi:hypothetical protein